MGRERVKMNKEFDRIVNKNINKWSRLNRWLATERLGKELIRSRLNQRKMDN